MKEQFSEDIITGLNSTPKTLPSKYFYDEVGDELFVQIMNLPEYYLTNSEMEIFKDKTNELITNLGVELNENFDLIELGPGDGSKTIHLLKKLSKQAYQFTYHPVDISLHALEGLENNILTEIPKIKIEKQQGDYFKILSQLHNDEKQKVILFLGSNIGNFKDDRARLFINSASEYMNSGDCILIGIDLIKPKEIVIPAYSDKSGVTAAFNLNLLDRINKTFNADFDRKEFYHEATYSESEGIARSFIVSNKKQTVHIKDLNMKIDFYQGEKIHTEVSRKYNEEIITNIIEGTGLEITGKLMDSKNYFSDIVLTKK